MSQHLQKLALKVVLKPKKQQKNQKKILIKKVNKSKKGLELLSKSKQK